MTTRTKKQAAAKTPAEVKSTDDALAKDAEKSMALAATMNAITTEQLEMNQLLGRIQAAHAIGNMLEALSLSQLQAIKEQKAYRALKGQVQEIDGKQLDLGTWEGFCRAIGASRETIDLRLKDLQLLGETALENAQNLGMTTRELRKLRKLDPSDQSVIINELEANIGDKDAIVELIENMSVKHRQEKEALQAQIKDEKAERKAADQVIAGKDKKINELSKALAKEENASPYDKAQTYAQEISVVETKMMAVFGEIDKLFQHINSEPELPAVLRVNQGHLLLELKEQSNRLIDLYQLGDVSVDDDQLDWIEEAKAAVQDGNMPDYVTSGVTGAQ